MRITCDKRYSTRAIVFFITILVIWVAGFLLPLLDFNAHPTFFAQKVWRLGYAWLSFWTAFTLATYGVSILFPGPQVLREVSRLSPDFSTAIICPVKNEDPELLLIRLAHSLDGNLAENMHFWLLSDSDKM
ncbi:MAG: hypothetical protein V2A34_02110, partial [Lentisphaerota bacterium]